MSKYLIIVAIVCFNFSYGQFNEDENAFRDTEKSSNSKMVIDNKIESSGNPGGEDDVPINDYIPLLILVAVGGIIYYQSKKKILK